MPIPKQMGVSALDIVIAAFSLISFSLVLFVYQRALTPLYGSGPTTYLLDTFVVSTVLLAVVRPFKLPVARNWFYACIGLTLAPNANYWVAVWTSRMREPIFGPAFTHLCVLTPLVFFLMTSIVEIQPASLPAAKKTISSPHIFRFAAAGGAFIVGRVLSQRVWANLLYLRSVSDSQIYLGLASLAWCLWILRSFTSSTPPKRPKPGSLSENQIKLILVTAFLVFWSSTYNFLASPVLPHPLKETYTHPSVPLQIHSSVQSETGLVVVGEALPPPDFDGKQDEIMHSVRYLRASHSILGGVWMRSKVNVLDDEPPVHDSFGTRLGDSIYSTFVLQEAARLVDSTERGESGLLKHVLIIGVGTGISATAFMRHGMSATIVEIDPAVYEAARTFFGLPDPGHGKVFLEDARAWAARMRGSVQAGSTDVSYDIVVHDCFTGGGVPENIFTIEFWEDLKAVMHPEGILVVNFAGILQTDSTRMVLKTLEKSFGQCRAFHDLYDRLTDAQYGTDFINMVFFCTSSKRPLTFRPSNKSDWLGSPLRRHVLSSLEKREVDLSLIRDLSWEKEDRYVLTDAHNSLGKYQNEQGFRHWKLMKEVLPDAHWETY